MDNITSGTNFIANRVVRPVCWHSVCTDNGKSTKGSHTTCQPIFEHVRRIFAVQSKYTGGAASCVFACFAYGSGIGLEYSGHSMGCLKRLSGALFDDVHHTLVGL